VCATEYCASLCSDEHGLAVVSILRLNVSDSVLNHCIFIRDILFPNFITWYTLAYIFLLISQRNQWNLDYLTIFKKANIYIYIYIILTNNLLTRIIFRGFIPKLNGFSHTKHALIKSNSLYIHITTTKHSMQTSEHISYEIVNNSARITSKTHCLSLHTYYSYRHLHPLNQ
jgi:hypothetical protein